MATKYEKKAGEKVAKAVHEMQEGTLKSGNSEQQVTNRKQAIVIGLSEAREEGAKVPKKPAATRKTTSKKAAPQKGISSTSSASDDSPKKKTATRKANSESSSTKKAMAKK